MTPQQSNKKFLMNNPWSRVLFSIRARCNNKNDRSYKWYGGRGIKCLITKEEIKSLWIRDNAYGMKKPSIDRIDNAKSYEISNCRFIEQSENTRISNLKNPRWVTKKGCRHDNGHTGIYRLKDIQCPTCLKEFHPYNYKIIFCSKACFNTSRRKKHEENILEVKS